MESTGKELTQRDLGEDAVRDGVLEALRAVAGRGAGPDERREVVRACLVSLEQ